MSSVRSRFNFQTPDPLADTRRPRHLPPSPEPFSWRKCVFQLTQKFATIAVVLVAILYAWFANYPEPPLSPMLYQWQEMGRNFEFRGYNIFYIDVPATNNESTTSKPTLLYLHGFPTSSHDIFKILPELRQNFSRIVAPDLIGFGFSDKPRHMYTYSLKDQAELVTQLVQKLELNSVHLLTHDYGNSVAQELLAQVKEDKAPFGIESVTMLNGGIFPARHRPIPMQNWLRTPVLGTIISKLSNFYFFSHSLSSVFGPNTKPEWAELNDMWKLIRLQDGYRVWGQLLSYIDERAENEDRWVGALRHCPVPLHFIYGPADPVNPPPFADYYREVIHRPSIDELPPSIGHYPQMEAPELVVRSFRRFLTSIGVAI